MVGSVFTLRSKTMMRSLLAVVAGVGLGAVGMAAVEHAGHGKVRMIAEREIAEKLDGKDSKVSFVEVSLEPGEANAPHRHPGAGVRLRAGRRVRMGDRQGAGKSV